MMKAKIAGFIDDPKIQAKFLSRFKGPNGSTLTFYVAKGGRVFIVQRHANDNGFEIYVTPTASNRIDDTLNAAERVLLDQ